MTPKTLQLSEPWGQAAYLDAGQGAPLVLLHGVGMRAAAWQPQIAVLARVCRVIAVDLPGHGGSSPLAGAAGLPEFVDWLHAVLMASETGPVSLAGHSMGALIAGGYTVTHPEMVTRVALLNGVFCRAADARAAVEARAAGIRAGGFDLQTPLDRWFGADAGKQLVRTQVADWLGSVDIEGYATAYTAFAGGDTLYADGFAKIACPLLAMTGEGDPNSTPEMSETMARTARNGRAVIIPGHRHMINLTAADAVNAELTRWLAAADERRETV